MQRCCNSNASRDYGTRRCDVSTFSDTERTYRSSQLNRLLRFDLAAARPWPPYRRDSTYLRATASRRWRKNASCTGWQYVEPLFVLTYFRPQFIYVPEIRESGPVRASATRQCALVLVKVRHWPATPGAGRAKFDPYCDWWSGRQAYYHNLLREIF